MKGEGSKDEPSDSESRLGEGVVAGEAMSVSLVLDIMSLKGL